MRCKHAWELQDFVLGHHKACVDSLVKELALDCQTKKLQYKIAASTLEQTQAPQMEHLLSRQASAFVEMVHRVEMDAAEKKIKEEFTCPLGFLLGLRVAIAVALIAAIATMSHELLMRVFAILFALGCGMALLWEDVLMLSFRIVLGHSIKRLESFRYQASQMNVNLPLTFWQ